MGRTAMSCGELRRAGVLARVESGELKLVNAAVIMGLSYRLQAAGQLVTVFTLTYPVIREGASTTERRELNPEMRLKKAVC